MTAPPLYQLVDNRLRLNFHPGQLKAWDSTRRIVCVLAGTQGGKALALDTLIPTPDGFVPMGELKAGDMVFDQTGSPCRVTFVSPVMVGNPCRRVTFDDGTEIVADAEHRWVTQDARQRKNAARRVATPNPRWSARPQCRPTADYSVRTTDQVGDSLLSRRGVSNHSVDQPGAFAPPSPAPLPMPPYTLGVWLGDGTSRMAAVTTADEDVLVNIRAEGLSVGEPYRSNSGKARSYWIGGAPGGGGVGAARANTLNARLRRLGLFLNKHIPQAYLFARPEDRLSLLQGLMDTDGHCAQDGRCEFVTIRKALADDVLVLLRGLGVKAYVARKIPTIGGRPCRPAYRITFTTTLPVFRIRRKAERLPYRTRPDTCRRFVVSVVPVPSVPVRCIAVDSPSRQYLCGKAFVPTHNTEIEAPWLWREIMRCGPGDYGYVAPSFTLMQKKALPTFRYLFEDLFRLGKVSFPCFNVSPQGEISLFGKRQTVKTRVSFGYAANSDSLESSTWKAAVLDECGQKEFKASSYDAILRRLSIAQGRLFMGTTPYTAGGWLKTRIYDRWKNGDPDIDVVNFPSNMNPTFPQAEWDRAKRDLPAWKFDLFYRGLLTRPVGLIYDSFDSARHMTRRFPIPADWPRYLGLDFGAVNTAAVKLAGELTPAGVPTGRLFLYATYHPARHGKVRLTPKEHVDELLKGEPGVPMAVGGSASEDDWRAEFGAGGLYVMEPAIRDVEVGIDRVYAAFRRDEIMVFDDLEDFQDEVETYTRVLDDAGQPTEKIAEKETSHILDALRYIVGWPKGDFGPWDPTPDPAARLEVTRLPADVFHTAARPRDDFDGDGDDGFASGGLLGGPLIPDSW